MLDLKNKNLYGDKSLTINHLVSAIDDLRDQVLNYTIVCEQEVSEPSNEYLAKASDELTVIDVLIKKLLRN